MAKMDVSALRQALCWSVAAFCALNLWGAEYFVSKAMPDDSGNGLTEATAKRTIQAAMDLTREGDIVTVLPGVYDEGEAETGGFKARVAITNKCIWLRSKEGKEKTFIKGRRSNTANGLGDDALRGVCLNNIGIVIEGFTICNGATPDDKDFGKGGGVHSVSYCYYNYVCDCVLSNNTAHTGGAFSNGTLLRCKVVGNSNTGNSSALYSGYAYSSVFCDNSGAAEMFRYCYDIVGCTIAGNTCATSYNGRNIKYSNCLVLDHQGKFGVSDHASANSYATNSVFFCADTEFKGHDKCEFGVTGHHFVAAPFGDFRLLSGSVAIGKGDAALTSKISIYSPIAERQKYIADTYYNRDFYGKPIPKSGAINCGAVQETVDPEGGCVVFYGDSNVQWATDAGNVYLKNRRAYAYAEMYPTQWCAKATFTDGKPLFKYEITPANTPQLCHYPEFDGTFVFSPPKKGETVTNHAYASHFVLHVDASSKAEAPDGLTPDTAFPTIQDAVDAASDVYRDRTYISVAPGVYDKGGAVYKDMSNRVAVAGKTLRIVSTHGAERTIIVGAPDPVTKGCGPNAVRCVAWYHSGRIGGLQGFTLTGGYTGVTPEGVSSYVESAAAAAYNGSMEHVLDCVITNNHAHWAAASKNGYFFRCLIADNDTVHQGTVWNSKLMSCRVEGNTVGNAKTPSVLWNGSAARFSTIDGAIGSKVELYGCVLKGGHSVGNDCILDNCVVPADVVIDEGAAITDCVFGNPALAGVVDLRPLSCSPALAHVQLSDIDVHLRYASADFNGRLLRFVDGCATAGAYQWPVQAVSVAVSRGGPQPLMVSGGTVGTNALETSASITVTAQKKSDSGRRFLGFTVDGVDYPADQLTYTIRQSGEPSGCISILANYSAVPMAVILR